VANAESIIACLSSPKLLESYREELPLIDHLLQTAELLWEDCGDPELTVAGLLHDLAWTDGSSETEHAADGSAIARSLGFSDRVCQLIGLHVTAKRYLVRIDPRYWQRLSSESKASLVEQGGALTLGELKEFEASAYFGDAIRLRLADDMAKDPTRITKGLECFYPIITKALLT